ncbi:MAG: hypothetical protein ABIL58_25510 [Pseudomonadota bacterium]
MVRRRVFKRGGIVVLAKADAALRQLSDEQREFVRGRIRAQLRLSRASIANKVRIELLDSLIGGGGVDYQAVESVYDDVMAPVLSCKNETTGGEITNM